jgi:hypothetical protein
MLCGQFGAAISDFLFFTEIRIFQIFTFKMSDLHKQTDDFDKINFEKMEKMIKLVAQIALTISNLDHKLNKEKNMISR